MSRPPNAKLFPGRYTKGTPLVYAIALLWQAGGHGMPCPYNEEAKSEASVYPKIANLF